MWWPFSHCGDGHVDDVDEGNGGGVKEQGEEEKGGRKS